MNTADRNLFSTQEQRDSERIGILKYYHPQDVIPFKNHTFQIREDADMIDLKKSVESHGIHEPAIAFWNEEGALELVAGHRRRHVCIELGLEQLPVLVKNITRDEAIIIMGETNLQRRSEILPSEKAFTYRNMLEAMKRQGKRGDLTFSPGEKKLKIRSSDKLAKKFNESVANIHRYIRLTYLIPELLKLVDEKRMGLKPAVEISYLSSKYQNTIFEYYEKFDVTPSHAQAIKLRKLDKEDLLDEEEIYNILSEEKANQKESFKLSSHILDRYFNKNYTLAEIENRIVVALQLLEKQEKIEGKKQNSQEMYYER